MPQFRAVWPPKESMMESGLSFWITFSVNSAVTGRKYVASAMPSEVCTVAMLGLMRTVWMPSSFRALSAWEPE